MLNPTDPLESLAAALSHSDQESRLAKALADVPEAIRASSPYHLMFHGDLLATDRAVVLSDQLYRRALILNPDEDLQAEIVARRYAALIRLGKYSQAHELAERLETDAERLSSHARALWLYYRGVWHWRLGRVEAARSDMAEVLALPEHADRRVAFTRFRARYALSAAAVDQSNAPEASLQTRSLLEMALRHGFHANLLAAFGQRLYAEQLDESCVVPLGMFLEVPGEAFDSPESGARFDFVTCFGVRAIRSGQLALAHSLFTYLRSEARRASLRHRSTIAEFWLMHVLTLQGATEAARERLAELRTMSAPGRFKDHLMVAWASLMIQIGRSADAEQALVQVDDRTLGDDDRARVALYRMAAALQSGDPSAPRGLRELLEQPAGERLKLLDARLLRRVGLFQDPPLLTLKLLGQPGLLLGGAVIEFPRRKTLSLLALLSLHPDGLSSEELIARLFPESEDIEPLAALRKIVYQTRQVLKNLDVPDPIEYAMGGYRLRQAAFAPPDCQELELLHRKALELEAQANWRGAEIFHRFVVWMSVSTAFDGLPEHCFAEPRRRLAAMGERSRAFLDTHEVPDGASALAWGEAWAFLAGSDPDLARRMRALEAAWAQGDEEQARAVSDDLLIETFIGDRKAVIARGVVLAQRCLMELFEADPASLVWTERLSAHARRHPAEANRLMGHAIALHSRIRDEGAGLLLPTLLAIPPAWMAAPDPVPWAIYLTTFGHYFLRVGEVALAFRIFARSRAQVAPRACGALDKWLAKGETVASSGVPLPEGERREPFIRASWFGEPAVRVEEEAIGFPRKKCLALLALLALHPQGLGVDALHGLLYPQACHVNAKKTIYTLVATTRQALDKAGIAHLIESLPGHYRLRGEAIGYCDRAAFDLLYAKGDELERLGYEAAAREFYRMATDLAERGPLFEGLSEPCFEELRRAHGEQALHAATRSRGV